MACSACAQVGAQAPRCQDGGAARPRAVCSFPCGAQGPAGCAEGAALAPTAPIVALTPALRTSSSSSWHCRHSAAMKRCQVDSSRSESAGRLEVLADTLLSRGAGGKSEPPPFGRFCGQLVYVVGRTGAGLLTGPRLHSIGPGACSQQAPQTLAAGGGGNAPHSSWLSFVATVSRTGFGTGIPLSQCAPGGDDRKSTSTKGTL